MADAVGLESPPPQGIISNEPSASIPPNSKALAAAENYRFFLFCYPGASAFISLDHTQAWQLTFKHWFETITILVKYSIQTLNTGDILSTPGWLSYQTPFCLYEKGNEQISHDQTGGLAGASDMFGGTDWQLHDCHNQPLSTIISDNHCTIVNNHDDHKNHWQKSTIDNSIIKNPSPSFGPSMLFQPSCSSQP